VVVLSYLSHVLLYFKHKSHSEATKPRDATAVLFGPGRRVPKSTLVVLLLVVISSLKIPNAFLIRSRAQQNKTRPWKCPVSLRIYDKVGSPC